MMPDLVEIGGSRDSKGSKAIKPAGSRHSLHADPGTRHSGVAASRGSHCRPDFAAINAAALRHLPVLLTRWLPDGRAEGQEWTARNPRRADRHLGSFKINLRTGRWSDFATGDCGGDPVSLSAYLFGLRQAEAARRLANMLGLPDAGCPHA
jgi:hypothetical protein